MYRVSIYYITYGLETMRINTQRNLKEKIEEMLLTKGTVVCDVLVYPDIPTVPRISSRGFSDGSIVSEPMEDLRLFMNREEFESSMLIRRDQNKGEMP